MMNTAGAGSSMGAFSCAGSQGKALQADRFFNTECSLQQTPGRAEAIWASRATV